MPWLLWSCQEQVSCLQCPNLQHWNDVASVRCRAGQRTLILTGQHLPLAAHGQKEAASSCCCEPLFQLKLEVDAHLCDLVWTHLMHQGPIPAIKAVWIWCWHDSDWQSQTPNVSPRSINLSWLWKLGASPKKHELAAKLVTDHKLFRSGD